MHDLIFHQFLIRQHVVAVDAVYAMADQIAQLFTDYYRYALVLVMKTFNGRTEIALVFYVLCVELD
jgi:hypothetical protein